MCRIQVLQDARSLLLPVKLPLLAGMSPDSREQMGLAGGLMVTDLGRNGNAWLSSVGVNQHGPPQRL